MPLEQQVCSLELAQKLKELGVKQESLYKHYNNGIDWGVATSIGIGIEIENDESVRPISAFTATELGETLNLKGWLSSRSKDMRWVCLLNHKDGELQFEADTEADARAKMLIYLIENNLITL